MYIYIYIYICIYTTYVAQHLPNIYCSLLVLRTEIIYARLIFPDWALNTQDGITS